MSFKEEMSTPLHNTLFIYNGRTDKLEEFENKYRESWGAYVGRRIADYLFWIGVGWVLHYWDVLSVVVKLPGR